ncbi:FadR family transcriptional regulator [Meridianimarinicoccus roseus]|jgi:DNA-binding FadR family transcriptional regulator|uniref:FadR family transcriptional regulator n=1 Tax=Meridianimarinicoccus roseus TaxID=2072018 RepID=A0A2V2LFT8_9RHOB|nr:FCD domain-containing protein [Meridianimarinicoccus roseus]PWR04325.1 FadR family transcriptional regulator [Meridianimarinicoccus roseus]
MSTSVIPDQSVRAYIVGAIEAGQYPGGARLPTERALSEKLSVSRSAVRTALAHLEGEGLIVRVGGSGTYVAENAAPRAEVADLTSPAQIMEARLAIEPPFARLVAEHGTQASFLAMQRCVDAGGAADSFEGFEHWDAELHAEIAAATRNPLMVEAYRLITAARNGAEWGVMKRRSLTNEVRAAYQADHERIVAALRMRDADLAEMELRQHLLTIRGNLLGY